MIKSLPKNNITIPIKENLLMARTARSARGQVVDFDILAIKESLASAPISISTEERRVFIDTKNGLKPKKNVAPANGLKVIATPEVVAPTLPDALKDVMSSINEANTPTPVQLTDEPEILAPISTAE